MESLMERYTQYDLIADPEERERVTHWANRMMEIEGAGDTVVMMRTVAESEGVPFGTVRRRFYAFRKNGVMALADKRKTVQPGVVNGIYPIFKTYCENDRESCKGGWDQLMRDFRCGKIFPFGTWRDLWKAETGSAAPRECPRGWIPRGWAYANLMRLYKNDPARQMALAWTRQGAFAALSGRLPVVRSRVNPETGENLPVGSIYQFDDVWHNFKTVYRGKLCQPLEFTGYDVASGYKFGSAIKPRTRSVDPKTGRWKGDNLTEFQFRTFVAWVLGVVGFHRDGVTLIGERGTTALRENVLERIRLIPEFGARIRFETGGLVNAPAYRGMFIGSAGGNPRMKSLNEGGHRVEQLAAASLPGNLGRDAAHQHESLAAAEKYAEGMLAKASDVCPAAADLLLLPFPTFEQYLQAFKAIEGELMERTDHQLEGWQNNWVTEYRLNERSEDWIDQRALLGMSENERVATTALVRQNQAALTRTRKMSRRDVWSAGQRDLVRLPLCELYRCLDPRDAKVLKVKDCHTIEFQDDVYYPGLTMRYVATARGRDGIVRMIAPGTTVRVYWNPVGELRKVVWVCDEDDRLIGVCRQHEDRYWGDPHAIEKGMGEQNAHMAALMQDVRFRHLPDEKKRLVEKAFNKALLEAAKEAAAEESMTRMGASAPLSLDDLAGEDDAASDAVGVPEAVRADGGELAFLDRMNGV